MSDTIERKTNDLLIIAGTLDEDTPMTDADWVGATAGINIVDSLGVAVRNNVSVTLDTTVTPKRVTYRGAPITTVGTYFYEWPVLFAGQTYPVTFPNDRTRHRLVMVDDLL